MSQLLRVSGFAILLATAACGSNARAESTTDATKPVADSTEVSSTVPAGEEPSVNVPTEVVNETPVPEIVWTADNVKRLKLLKAFKAEIDNFVKGAGEQASLPGNEASLEKVEAFEKKFFKLVSEINAAPLNSVERAVLKADLKAEIAGVTGDIVYLSSHVTMNLEVSKAILGLTDILDAMMAVK